MHNEHEQGIDAGKLEHNPWKRQTRRVVYDNPWITVYHDDVLRPDGNPGIYGQVHFKNRAIGVVALDVADRVLLVGQFRYTLDIYSWEIPEGGAPFEEEPIEGAKRELLEETGFTAVRWREIVRAHLSNSVSDEEAIIYLAEDLQPGTASPEPTEELRIQWLPFATALQMTFDGRITDSMSVMGLQRTALLRKAD